MASPAGVGACRGCGKDRRSSRETGSSPNRATDSSGFPDGQLTHPRIGEAKGPARAQKLASKAPTGQETLDQGIEGSNPSSPAKPSARTRLRRGRSSRDDAALIGASADRCYVTAVARLPRSRAFGGAVSCSAANCSRAAARSSLSLARRSRSASSRLFRSSAASWRCCSALWTFVANSSCERLPLAHAPATSLNR
jgi:hypothetical protein